MLETWTTRPQVATKHDAGVLTMNVLIHSVFGRPSSLDFGDSTDSVDSGGYQGHLEVLLRYPYHFLAIPHWLLNFLISPRKWRLVGRAATQFRAETLSMLDQERKDMANGISKENLMSTLLRNSEAEKRTLSASTRAEDEDEYRYGPRLGLTDDELLGNLYFYNVAGNDTITNLLVYTVIELAAHPEWQEWVRDEVQHALQSRLRLEDCDYSEIFPKLKRCRAVMVSCVAYLIPFCRATTDEIKYIV